MTHRPHHIWCNFQSPLFKGIQDSTGCKQCDNLYKNHPYQEGDTEETLAKRYFPDNVMLKDE
jgi:hypothetical protein